MTEKSDYLTEVLAGRKTLLFDGGFGTMLQARGLGALDKPADGLCITNAPEITVIHKAYVDAGAQVITTNTFNTNERMLRATSSPYAVDQLYAAAATCARNAGALFVAGDIGPLGEFLEPYGDLEEEEAYQLFACNAQAAQAAGCDLIAIETMMDINEAVLAVRAARENTSLPVFATLSFNESGRTLFGVSPDQAVEELLAAGVHALGMNCSVGPTEALPVVQAYAAALRAAGGNTGEHGGGETAAANAWPAACGFAVPLIVQPNAGLPDMSTGQAVYRCSPQEFSCAVEQLVRAGASIVGGCCGTTPAHIAALRELLRNMQ